MGPTPTSSFEDAFDGLFLAAFGVARRIVVDPLLAEDIAAEASARAYAHWRRIGAAPWREGWVVRTASNLAIDHVRAQSRREPNVRPSDNLTDTTVTPVDDDVALRTDLAQAIAALPRRQREVVTLRYLAALSEAETAEAMRVSTGTVKTHLHRGLESLRRHLDDRSIQHIGAVTADV